MSQRGSVVFESVSKRYGEVTAVNAVSFEILPGELVTLVGPSGCGKTTTLRMIAGLELPSAGRILIGGRDVTHAPANERDVGMVFQSYALFPHLTVLENVAYGLRAQGKSRDEANQRASARLGAVGLSEMGGRYPSELSGGQQQRVALARALVLEPEVLLFDEPLSNLDTRLRRQMREEIRELQQRLGITAVYVTHSHDEALSISDRILAMDRSIVVQMGTPSELYEKPATAFAARFMGDANIVRGLLQNGTVHFGPLSFTPASTAELPEGDVEVALRPQRLLVHTSRPAEAALAGRVTSSAYLGDHVEYGIDTELGPLFAVSTDSAAAAMKGAEVWLTLKPGSPPAVLRAAG